MDKIRIIIAEDHAVVRQARAASWRGKKTCRWWERRRMGKRRAGERRHLQPAAELMLFRIAQEALNHAQRHSGASKVFIRMQERAQLPGGALTIDTAPGQGTTLTVEVPL